MAITADWDTAAAWRAILQKEHTMDEIHNDDQRSINSSLRARVAALEDRVARLEARLRSLADGHDDA